MKTLGVPPQCRHNPGDWKKVKELVAKILTAMRNDMKSKVRQNMARDLYKPLNYTHLLTYRTVVIVGDK